MASSKLLRYDVANGSKIFVNISWFFFELNKNKLILRFLIKDFFGRKKKNFNPTFIILGSMFHLCSTAFTQLYIMIYHNIAA